MSMKAKDQAVLENMTSMLFQILRIHFPVTDGDTVRCNEDQHIYPCPTAKVIKEDQ